MGTRFERRGTVRFFPVLGIGFTSDFGHCDMFSSVTGTVDFQVPFFGFHKHRRKFTEKRRPI
jgi:hypothetical protein